MGLFHHRYEEMADLLRGKILRIGQKVFTINVAEGFARTENDKGIYRPVVDMTPGEVYCPRSRNTILFLIACLDGRGRGGCVLIREILSPLQGVISKPGNVSAALGINIPKTAGRIVELAGGELRLELYDTQDTEAPTAKVAEPVVETGISKAVLQRYMPRIAVAYAKKGTGTFQEFVAQLGRCRTEAQLRKELGV